MAILTSVTFNGKRLDPRVFRVEHLPDYNLPERDVKAVHVEGRSGDVVIDSGSYKNIKRSYKISFGAAGPSDFAARVSEISKWLDCSGYGRLSDSYEKDCYRMAYPVGAKKVESILNGRMGKVEVEFSCIPKRFLTYGENGFEWVRLNNMVTPYSKGDVDGDGYITKLDAWMALSYATGRITLTDTQKAAADCVPTNAQDEPVGNGEVHADDARWILNHPKIGWFKLYNPTEFGSSPIFICTVDRAGYCRIEAGHGVRMDFADSSLFTGENPLEEVVVDCERETVYDSATGKNLNKYVTLESGKFPELYGKYNNKISFEGPISKVKVYPQFWVR